jgi:hypothetical protein
VLYPSLVLPRASKMQPKGTEEGEADTTGRGDSNLKFYKFFKFQTLFLSRHLSGPSPLHRPSLAFRPLWKGRRKEGRCTGLEGGPYPLHLRCTGLEGGPYPLHLRCTGLEGVSFSCRKSDCLPPLPL